MEEKPPEPEYFELVVIASSRFEVQAQEIKLFLESHGIECALKNEIMSQADWIVADMDGGVKVMVRKEDAPRASKILEEA